MENALSRKITLNNSLVFEPEKKIIAGKGRKATISASAALCMELLIDNVGQLVTHQQFFDYVWRRFGMEPTPTSLYQNISALRRALNKAGLQEDIIRTMPRRGFLLSPQTTILKENISPSASVISNSEAADIVTSTGTATDFSEVHAVENLISEQEKKVSGSNFQYLSHPALIKARAIFVWLPFGKILVVTTLVALIFSSFYFSYYRISLSSDSEIFVYITDYKGCTVFNNADAWLSKYEVKKQIDNLNVDCTVAPYIYLTAFKHANSFSYFDCQNPLSTNGRANCRSHYFVKNLNDE